MVPIRQDPSGPLRKHIIAKLRELQYTLHSFFFFLNHWRNPRPRVALSVVRCAGLGWAGCRQSVAAPLALLIQSFSVSVFWQVLLLALGFRDFHSGVLSLGGCFSVSVRGMKSGTMYIIILIHNAYLKHRNSISWAFSYLCCRNHICCFHGIILGVPSQH